MSLVSFATLPTSARVWVFGSATPLTREVEVRLLAMVDEYLHQWKGHGIPLIVGRDWREHQFLTIAVDTTQAAASGCSIDGLFRALRQAEPTLGVSLMGSGHVYYRGADDTIVCVDRATFHTLAERGVITRDTIVFDTTVATLGGWRASFETTAGQSWHETLLPVSTVMP